MKFNKYLFVSINGGGNGSSPSAPVGSSVTLADADVCLVFCSSGEFTVGVEGVSLSRLGMWSFPRKGTPRYEALAEYLKEGSLDSLASVQVPSQLPSLKVSLGGMDALSDLELCGVRVAPNESGACFGSKSGSDVNVVISDCEFGSSEKGGWNYVSLSSTGSVRIRDSKVWMSLKEVQPSQSPGGPPENGAVYAALDFGEVSCEFVCEGNELHADAHSVNNGGYGSEQSCVMRIACDYYSNNAVMDTFAMRGNSLGVSYSSGCNGIVPSMVFIPLSDGYDMKSREVVCESNLVTCSSDVSSVSDSCCGGMMISLPRAVLRLSVRDVEIDLPYVSRISYQGMICFKADETALYHEVSNVSLSLGSIPKGEPVADSKLSSEVYDASYHAVVAENVTMTGISVSNPLGNGLKASGCDVTGTEIGGRLYLSGCRFRCDSCTGTGMLSNAVNVRGSNSVSIGKLTASGQPTGNLVRFSGDDMGGDSHFSSDVFIRESNVRLFVEDAVLGGTVSGAEQSCVQCLSDGALNRYSLHGQCGSALTWGCYRQDSARKCSLRLEAKGDNASGRPLATGAGSSRLVMSDSLDSGEYLVTAHCAVAGQGDPDGILEYRLETDAGSVTSRLDGHWSKDSDTWDQGSLQAWKWTCVMTVKASCPVRGRILYWGKTGIIAYAEPSVDASKIIEDQTSL